MVGTGGTHGSARGSAARRPPTSARPRTADMPGTLLIADGVGQLSTHPSRMPEPAARNRMGCTRHPPCVAGRPWRGLRLVEATTAPTRWRLGGTRDLCPANSADGATSTRARHFGDRIGSCTSRVRGTADSSCCSTTGDTAQLALSAPTASSASSAVPLRPRAGQGGRGRRAGFVPGYARSAPLRERLLTACFSGGEVTPRSLYPPCAAQSLRSLLRHLRRVAREVRGVAPGRSRPLRSCARRRLHRAGARASRPRAIYGV
jgi:hypothetical protein